jgi:flagellar basal-body rod protein FlgC
MSIDLYASVAGINAFFKKMDVTAHNVANLNTDNYKRRIPQIGQDKNGLPETKVTTDNTPGLENPRRVGEPEGPPREMSNVTYTREAVSMIEAEMGVKANVTALKVAGETFGSLLDIFA